MKKYLSHFSAAYHWNIPYIDNTLGAERTAKYRDGRVVDITVTNSTSTYDSTNRVVHQCEMKLPYGAVKRSGNLFVSSPEFVFLQLAKELDIQRLILLGLQMCSHPPNRESKELTSTRKLNSLVKRTPKFHGIKKATRALKYIENGSNSLMESLAFMILTLPNYLGGYGLRGASFNREIPLDEIGREQLKQKKCFADLYFEKERLAIEYDSFTHHSTPSAQSKDLIRESTLKRQGIDVIRFGTVQLYDEKACEELALNIASSMGKRIRIRIRNDVFTDMQGKIRALLPYRESLFS